MSVSFLYHWYLSDAALVVSGALALTETVTDFPLLTDAVGLRSSTIDGFSWSLIT